MKKTILLLLLITTSIIISSCTTTGNVILNNEDNTIYIGAPLSFTGKYASIGADMHKGISLALKDLNNDINNKYKFEVIYEDTKSDPKTALTTINKLLDINNVDFFIGPINSQSVLTVRPLTEENKKILFAVTSAEGITDNTKYLIKNRETGKSHAKTISKFIFSSGKKRVGILNANNPNANTCAEWTKKYLLDYGLSIVAKESYNPSLETYNTIILKILQKNPEVLYIAGASGVDAGLIVKELKQMGYKGEITGSGVFGLEEFLITADSSAEGVYYSYFTFNKQNQIMNSFIKKYEDDYGLPPSNFAAIAYDDIILLSQAVNHCNSNKPDCVVEYFHKIRDYNGVSGLTSFDDKGNAEKTTSVMTIHNNQRMTI